MSGEKTSSYSWKRQMSGKEIAALLKENNWEFVNSEGSHHHYRKNKIKVTIPIHGNRSIAIGTLHNIKRMVNFAESQTK